MYQQYKISLFLFYNETQFNKLPLNVSRKTLKNINKHEYFMCVHIRVYV